MASGRITWWPSLGCSWKRVPAGLHSRSQPNLSARKDIKVYGYSLSLNLIEYQSAILRGDMEAAKEIFPTVPKDQRSRVARFLEAQDLKELAL